MKKRNIAVISIIIVALLVASFFLRRPSGPEPEPGINAGAAEDIDVNTENTDNANMNAESEDSDKAEEPDAEAANAMEGEDEQSPETPISEDGEYYSKDEVALYIHTYGHLPDNFITKKEAQSLGWSGGSLEKFAPGKAIGGDRFGNYEGNLPDAQGRTYTECDIDTLGQKSRGAKRIVFSNDGLIYYTEDHYESFQLLYGDKGE